MALPLQFTLSLSLSLIKMSNVPKQTEEDSKAHLCVFVCECSSISMMVSVCKILICPSRVQPYLFLFPEIQFIVALARIAYGSLHRIFSNFIWRWHFDRCHGIRIPPSIATQYAKMKLSDICCIRSFHPVGWQQTTTKHYVRFISLLRSSFFLSVDYVPLSMHDLIA